MSGIEWGNGEMWVEMQIELEIGLTAMAEVKDQRNFLIPGILVSINFSRSNLRNQFLCLVLVSDTKESSKKCHSRKFL